MTASADATASPEPTREPQRSPSALRSPVTALVLDLIAIALFGLFARVAHQSEDMPLNVMGWLSTTWPFWLGVLVAWLLLWFGVLGNRSGHEVAAGVPVWAITVVTGLLIWSVRNGAVPHWSFMLVATIMSAILLLGWRTVGKFVRR